MIIRLRIEVLKFAILNLQQIMFKPFSLSKVKKVTIDTVKEAADKKFDAVIVDVRMPVEYAQGHIDGSLLLPLPELVENLSKIPDKTKKVYVYCRRGIRSANAAEQLKSLGYTDVHSMSGGIEAWIEKGYPTVK